ncbi:2,3-diphosphoglycerate-dependent phosphoglycerate mutase [archaeon]|nr:MAG: 2,3-diphosphoglycerate-dependent phosphoglycerate mutase [archaeon]
MMIHSSRHLILAQCHKKAALHTVVLIRHGESLWNQEKRFTGWCDVPLTPGGEADAKDAGVLIGERGIKFDVAFTSNLERAWRTCAMVLASSGQGFVETHRSWYLNERHYGALQGHSKTCSKLTQAFGEQRLIDWRRSYHSAPPSLYDINFLRLMGPDSLDTCTEHMNIGYIDQAAYAEAKTRLKADSKDLSAESYVASREIISQSVFPDTESLKQCQERAYTYWQNIIAPRVKNHEKVLIVAHANTIRALVKVIDSIEDDDIAHLKIPNGIPLVYTLDDNLQPTDLTDDIGFQAKYLVSARNHGKVSAYTYTFTYTYKLNIPMCVYMHHTYRPCHTSAVSARNSAPCSSTLTQTMMVASLPRTCYAA